jgi:cyclopropane fatty-acyl-phospholipid synthase-like methyltransferase
MVDAATLAADAVVSTFDFSAVRHVIDIGGGYGILLTRIMQKYPVLRGTLFDLASLRERAEAEIKTAHLTGRCEFHGGDYFQSVPSGGDLHLLSRVLMAHDDEGCTRILQSCHRAMEPNGRVLVIQQIMPDHGTGADVLLEATLSDLNMLVMLGGHDRTEAEYRRLLLMAGFDEIRTVPTQSLMSIIEAVRQ